MQDDTREPMSGSDEDNLEEEKPGGFNPEGRRLLQPDPQQENEVPQKPAAWGTMAPPPVDETPPDDSAALENAPLDDPPVDTRQEDPPAEDIMADASPPEPEPTAAPAGKLPTDRSPTDRNPNAGQPAGADLKFPDEGPRIAEGEIDRLMMWAADMNASDITIQTNQPVWIEVYGRLCKATRRSLTTAEVADVLNRLYGANGAAQIASGKDIDMSYEIRPDRRTRYRYRVNATGILSDGSDGIQITARTMPEDPPLLADLDIEPKIVENIAPRQGLVLVTGPTGSGKSTLLASIIRNLAEDPEGHRKILTYEAPIEFVYDGIDTPSSVISQTEIPRHLSGFAAGIRNALRRKPMVILVGEARDPETMGAAAEASLTGHLVYSTVHANGVSETVRRMISIFDAEERQARAIDLMESMRLVITQALLRTVDGKRVGIREFLVFDEFVRDTLLSHEVERWPLVTRDLIKERGQSMVSAAKRVYDAGRIDERTYRVVAARAKAAEEMMERSIKEKLEGRS